MTTTKAEIMCKFQGKEQYFKPVYSVLSTLFPNKKPREVFFNVMTHDEYKAGFDTETSYNKL